MKRFTRRDLPSSPTQWPRWRKSTLTRAVRIEGPFLVHTREGDLACKDGWLALDQGGWPYPIADEEFRRIYQPVEEES